MHYCSGWRGQRPIQSYLQRPDNGLSNTYRQMERHIRISFNHSLKEMFQSAHAERTWKMNNEAHMTWKRVTRFCTSTRTAGRTVGFVQQTQRVVGVRDVGIICDNLGRWLE